jgi:quercetin dioxygenase-like cupin family protein/heme-degrading monooxygenase HmoA
MSGARGWSVLRPGELPARDRGNGARTVPLVTGARGATGFLNGMTLFDPGAAIGHHTHNVAESVVVVEGSAVVDIDGERFALDRFDTTFVPANVPHHFENASDTEPMRILWTYASPDATRTIVATGEHGRIDAEHAGSGTGGGGGSLVREVARITVREGAAARFEEAVAQAAPLFQRARGARTLTLERSEEDPLEYLLVVGWETVEDHTEGFRGSADFQEWRRLIADCVVGLPQVAHHRNVLTAF